MKDMEFDSIWSQLEKMKEQDTANEEFNKPEDELRTEYQGLAERRVKLGLLLSEIARQNQLVISEEEIVRQVMVEAQQYPGQESQVIDYYTQHPEAKEALKGPILEEKVVDFLIEKVKLEEKSCSLKELTSNTDDEAA